ncbi:MAG TPA: RagB/SusD family nutrient uptake outer membrane protein [Bacteroidetes bacterium]|nr:RagB/SusD family nutrient uptake outer membrane protein [Bacteroidota bacterium]
MKKIPLSILAVFLFFTSCKDYLDVAPETEFTNDNFWTSESNIESFSYGLYDAFKGYGNGGFFGGDHFFSVNNDDVIALDQRLELDFRTAVPATPSGTDWTWDDIRKANVLIEGVTNSPLAQTTKDRYIAVGRFFRALLYWEKVKRYGDVPFYDHPISPSDDGALYAARDSRVEVVNRIVEDLNFAIANLPDETSKVKVTKWTALALKSRVCLAAATTFKYHNVAGGDVNKLLNESIDASEQLMNAHFSLHGNYAELFSSEDLSSNSEIILMKKYNENMRHSILSFIFHEPFFGFSHSAVSAFLMSDGKPISYDGSTHPGYSEWVFTTTDTIRTSNNAIKTSVGIAANRDKRLAAIVDTSRLVTLFSKGIPMFSPIKYATYDLVDNQPTQGVQATSDAPIFRLGEVLLNFAEAKAEAGTITQDDLDRSINLLRDRAGVAHLTIDVGFSADDRDPTVDPLLWEIRRERRVELMLEPFRKWDLIRWAKGEYYDAEDSFYGVRVDPNVVFENGITVLTTPDGHLYAQAPGDRRTPWDDRKYLEPIPADQLVLNPQLTQNPGW